MKFVRQFIREQWFTLLALVLIAFLCTNVFAEDRRHPPRGGDVDVDTTVKTPVDVDVDAPVNVNTKITQNRNQVRQVPNAYLNYTPNYIQCQRTLGLQFATSRGVASLGAPLPRSKACDIWLAVNEAQENGHILLSYAFMCEIKNIQRVWGKDRCNEITDTAGQWWIATLDEDTEKAAQLIERFVPPDAVQIAATQHGVLEEELEKTKEQVRILEAERREHEYEQQQVKQQVQQQEEREVQRKMALDAFLEELEAREQPDE